MKMLDLLGNTPLVLVDNINGNNIYAKLEYCNPTGSIKDRPAYYMITKALERGEITKDTTIIEPTSGNTGIGLAFVCRRLGMKVILTLPESMSIERRQILQALGAELVLTPASKGMQGTLEEADRLHKEIANSFIPNQFANPDNALSHYETTAPEVFGEVDADYIIDGVGSGGTLMGFKRYIEDNGKDCKIVAVEPDTNTVLSTGKTGPHGIQGIGANFVPDLVDKSKIDQYIIITTEEARAGAKKLALDYGIMGGISSGANLMAALRLAEEVTGKDIVIIVPDNATKYLSMSIYG